MPSFSHYCLSHTRHIPTQGIFLARPTINRVNGILRFHIVNMSFCWESIYVVEWIVHHVRMQCVYPVVQQGDNHCIDVCGTLKCENAAICEKVAKCEKISTLHVKIDAICEKNNAKCEKMRLSKCVKDFDSKCVKIDSIIKHRAFFKTLIAAYHPFILDGFL